MKRFQLLAILVAAAMGGLAPACVHQKAKVQTAGRMEKSPFPMRIIDFLQDGPQFLPSPDGNFI